MELVTRVLGRSVGVPPKYDYVYIQPLKDLQAEKRLQAPSKVVSPKTLHSFHYCIKAKKHGIA